VAAALGKQGRQGQVPKTDGRLLEHAASGKNRQQRMWCCILNFQELRKETELFFESIIREDRSVPGLLKSNYTYLNERLAKAEAEGDYMTASAIKAAQMSQLMARQNR